MNTQKVENIALNAFKSADTMNKGEINLDQLINIIGQISIQIGIQTPSQHEINDILKDFDDNGDGALQKDEFREFIFALFDHETDKANQKKKQKDQMNLSASTFLSKVQQKKDDLINSKYIQLLQNAQQQSRTSVLLDHQQEILQHQIEDLECPFTNNEKELEKWRQERKAKLIKGEQLFHDYQEQQEIDHEIMEHEHAHIMKDHGVTSVYTELMPHHKTKEELLKEKQILQQQQVRSKKNSQQLDQSKQQQISNDFENQQNLQQENRKNSIDQQIGKEDWQNLDKAQKLQKFAQVKSKKISNSHKDLNHQQLKQRISMKCQKMNAMDDQFLDFDIKKQIEMFEGYGNQKKHVLRKQEQKPQSQVSQQQHSKHKRNASHHH